jgi:hypothetical protein
MFLRRTAIAAILLIGLTAWAWLRWLEHDVELQPYSLIEDRLYVGGLVKSPPPGTNAVLNLCQQDDSYRTKSYRADPIDGSEPPSIDWLKDVIKYIDDERRAGNTVYVHCFAGMNRSGMVATAYLMYEHGWSRDEALTFAQSKRPQIQPNLSMMRFLMEWERVLKERK